MHIRLFMLNWNLLRIWTSKLNFRSSVESRKSNEEPFSSQRLRAFFFSRRTFRSTSGLPVTPHPDRHIVLVAPLRWLRMSSKLFLPTDDEPPSSRSRDAGRSRIVLLYGVVAARPAQPTNQEDHLVVERPSANRNGRIRNGCDHLQRPPVSGEPLPRHHRTIFQTSRSVRRHHLQYSRTATCSEWEIPMNELLSNLGYDTDIKIFDFFNVLHGVLNI